MQLLSCGDSGGQGCYFSDVYASGDSTDVCLRADVYDNCNGATYGINADSNQKHPFPTSGYTRSYTVAPALRCWTLRGSRVSSQSGGRLPVGLVSPGCLTVPRTGWARPCAATPAVNGGHGGE